MGFKPETIEFNSLYSNLSTFFSSFQQLIMEKVERKMLSNFLNFPTIFPNFPAKH
jgi:hypothetical protein